jgi:aromatic-L-amino-acid/L-tryptophan decarboxylase
MGEQQSRKATLDLADAQLDALLVQAGALAAREIRAARDGPIFAEPPSAERLERVLDSRAELPLDGEPLDDLLESCAAVLAAGRRTGPAFFGYVFSPASPIGVAADLLASAADQNVTSWRSAPAATQMERITVRWLGQLVGFAADAAGILVSGGSMANLTALLVALRAHAQPDADRRTLTAYASEDAHFSIDKAAAVIGVALRHVGADAGRRLDVPALRDAIAADRRAGRQPFCVVGSAGTTSTGAVDGLDAIATIAEDEGLWLHVDGAYGALAAADQASRPLFSGIDRADSLSIDAHKWLYAPVDCGALLVRDAEAGPRAFGSLDAAYVRVRAEEGPESFAFWDHGIELSRRFRALKLWMTLRYYGARHIADAIAEDIAMAAYMGDLVREREHLELLTEPSLSVCCFRHVPAGMAEAALDRHNERLLGALQRDGRAYLSNATVDGRFTLRACITNFRTTRHDIDRTVQLVCDLGSALTAHGTASGARGW